MKILQTHPQLNRFGITAPNRIYWQLNTPQLYEEAVRRYEGYVAHLGPLAVRTGNHTSLAYTDRFIVSEPPIQGNISWSEVIRPFDSDRFDRLLTRMAAYFQGLDIFMQDAYVRLSKDETMPIRVVTETAWHNLFVRNSYLHSDVEELEDFAPEFTILHAPNFRAVPDRDGTNSDVFVITHFTRKLILIGGTSFPGEIQKAIFTVLNYLLPRQNVLTMECAANTGNQGEVALFVGIDGSGKTCLAADNTRTLLGDSEHGWNEEGVFSIGRGCYAKILGLSEESSPEVWDTTRRFGTILENAEIDARTRLLNLETGVFTENVRASYPISHIPHATRLGAAGHPHHVILLVKDVFGLLPPVSKLSAEQAHYYYLLGYTPELVTDRYGEVTPQAKFSTCYAAPFMPLHPGHYAKMFADKIKQHHVEVWLLNTGWTGGEYPNGRRIPLESTRKIVRAILDAKLSEVEFQQEGYFDLMVPANCPGISEDILHPVKSWASERHYAEAAKRLIKLFDQHNAQHQNEMDSTFLATQPSFG
jgi:phosphoenolpyruvate carboxykinase (ATP)